MTNKEMAEKISQYYFKFRFNRPVVTLPDIIEKALEEAERRGFAEGRERGRHDGVREILKVLGKPVRLGFYDGVSLQFTIKEVVFDKFKKEKMG